MTKIEFAGLEQNKKIKKNIGFCAIVCYIAAALTLVVNLMAGQIGGLLDVAILLALGLIIHLRKSFPAAIILLIYGVINMVAVYMLNQTFGGWLILVAGIYAVIETSKLNKAWKAFQSAPPAAAQGAPDVYAENFTVTAVDEQDPNNNNGI